MSVVGRASCLQLLDDGASKVGRLVVAAHVRRPVSAQARVRPALASRSGRARFVQCAATKARAEVASRYIIQRGVRTGSCPRRGRRTSPLRSRWRGSRDRGASGAVRLRARSHNSSSVKFQGRERIHPCPWWKREGEGGDPHHGGGEDHGGGICDVLALDVLGDVTAVRREGWVFFVRSATAIPCTHSLLGPNRIEPGWKREERAEVTYQPGSNRAYSLPMLAPGTIPGPPTRAAPMLLTIEPYRFGMTMTSNCWGRFTSCIEVLSTLFPVKHTPKHRSGTPASPQRGSPAWQKEGEGNAHHVGEGDARVFVLLGDPAASVEEETVTELHNVGLVNSRDVLQGGESLSERAPNRKEGRARPNAPCGRS